MTNPANLPFQHATHLDKLTSACLGMTTLAGHVAAFAGLIARRDGGLQGWIDAVNADALSALHAFARGLNNDRAAVDAGLTMPYSNGPTEGVNNKIKLLKRQTYGRAGFTLLRQRNLLN
jgi:transposase